MLPKHVKRVRSKGRDYYYFDTGKRVDGKKVYTRLPDLRSVEFGGSYAAMLGHRNRRAPGEMLRIPKLVDLYQRGSEYRGLADSSKRIYDIYLRRIEKLLPTAPAGEIERSDMVRLIDGMGETPGAANLFLAVSGAMFRWAKERGHVRANPCEDIKPLRTGEHDPWPNHILLAALNAESDRVRLLTHLLYFTTQRISDVLAMAWTDIAGDRITVRQRKTGKVLSIPLHRDLKAELAQHQKRGLLIVTGETGRPISAVTARGNLQDFAKGLGAKVVPHGLRKNGVNALLEAGCSMAETAAISGQSLQMVEHYAKRRNQSKLADAAVLRWERNETATYKPRKTS